jgi:hypothetical protein
MRSMNPYKIWLFPQRNSQSRNALPHSLSIPGDAQ